MQSGKTLKIEPGVVVKFYAGIGLIGYGTLKAEGSSTSKIIFTSIKDDTYGGDTNNDGTATSPSAGDWRGIYLYGESYYHTGIGQFDYCLIRYGGNAAGDADANLYFNQSDSSYFKNSTSEYSSQDGVKIYDCSPTIAWNTITANKRGLYSNSTAFIITPNDIYGNTDYGAYKESGGTLTAINNWWGAVDGP